ncbi:MAG: DUF5320 family protein [Desulfobacterales bacterium]|nr:DUF5320 family protein [Desulfobacterales bacterium]
MKIALTIWGNRISPVFDSARKLIIVEVQNNKVVNRQYELLNSEMASDLNETLTNLGINVLICGAISKRFSDMIETSKIKLISFITGQIDVVLEAYIKNKIVTEFLMPGCKKNIFRQRNGCGGFKYKNAKEVNMPKSDGTGPQGQGAGTGRGQGPCKGNGQGQSKGQGQGQGRGQGKGKGKGQGGDQGKS